MSQRSRDRIRFVYFSQLEDRPAFMTRAQFMDLPREARALLVVRDEVEFLDAEGWTVPLPDALAELRASWETASGLRMVQRPNASGDERRRHARFPFARAADLNGEDAGMIQDISRGGARVRTRRSFAPGDTVELAWGSSYTGRRQSTRTAVVRRVASDPPGKRSIFPVEVALEFADLSNVAAR